MSVRLVTAFKGYDPVTHEPIKSVSSTDDATLYAALVGPDDYVFDHGQRLVGTMEDANTLVVADGDGLINGHHFIVDGTLSFTIPTGTQGMQVSNLACLRYTKDAEGIQNVAPVVLTGEPAAEDPQDPAYNEGDALGGVSTADFPLYRVVTTGISAGEPEQLFDVVGPLSRLATLERENTVRTLGVTSHIDHGYVAAYYFHGLVSVGVNFDANVNVGRSVIAVVKLPRPAVPRSIVLRGFWSTSRMTVTSTTSGSTLTLRSDQGFTASATETVGYAVVPIDWSD